MERIVEHVELDSVRPGMTVTLNGREIGRVEDLILQPDNLHVLRLITRRASTGQRIAIPIEWVRGIQDGCRPPRRHARAGIATGLQSADFCACGEPRRSGPPGGVGDETKAVF
jgi:sporulation protein YlmC with PRC-barrel domain